MKFGKEFTLIEEIAPSSFVKASEIKFEILNTSEIQKVHMVDKIVEISKTDYVTGEELPGAELIVTDKDGNEIDKWISTTEPHYLNNAKEGETYKLTEKSSPYGFCIAESIEFTVTTDDKQTQKIEMKDMPILKDIELIKIDSKTKEVIKQDFSFGMYEDENCTKLIKEVHSDKSKGTILFKDNRYGIFYIKECQEPNSYIRSEEVIKVEINDKGTFINDKLVNESEDGIIRIEFENEKIEVPHTGDNSNMYLYIVLFIMSVISLVTVGVYKHNKKK